jgi:lipid A ethanolaminephosphotransferase
MVRQLREAMAADTGRDLVVVMHQIGSHGPSYFKRYTQDYRRFAPTCDTNQLQSCSQAELVNSYDDSILYTDHILAETIDVLAGASDRFDTAMLYVSDHGESLGEKGIYLHGMPYMFAPDAQTHVPMVLWTSPGYRAATALDMACVRGEAGKAYSHDNLFHSVLGMFGVRTDVYRTDLDLLAPCRPGAAVAHVAGLATPDETARP